MNIELGSLQIFVIINILLSYVNNTKGFHCEISTYAYNILSSYSLLLFLTPSPFLQFFVSLFYFHTCIYNVLQTYSPPVTISFCPFPSYQSSLKQSPFIIMSFFRFTFQMRENMQYLFFRVWLILPHMMISSSTHFPANEIIFLLYG
jgi:hypothetical protein